MAVALLVALLPMLSVKIRAASSSSDTQQFTVRSTFAYGTNPYISNGAKPPPSDAECRQKYKFSCYSPQEMYNAYGLNPLIQQGYNGKGQTIIVVVPFGSPTIQQDLLSFDQGYVLAPPPSFKLVTPFGTKPYNPKNANRVNWATETTLDVEWSHALAPGANIVLVTTPSANLSQLLQAEQYALANHLGQIISQSWAVTENTLFNPSGIHLMKSFDAFYQQAAADNVTVFSATGDTGAANPDNNGKYYPFATVNFPASDPNLTAVGGTVLTASVLGKFQYETGWTRSGGGVSQYWPEPTWQRQLNPTVQNILKNHRGLPDVSYNADQNKPIVIYQSFPPQKAGYYTISGASEGPPQWSGIIADGNQYAGHPLGFLNQYLYELGVNGQTVYHDSTVGNNTYHHVTGYSCMPGWDPVTGWGSPQSTNLILQLIQLESH